MNSQFDFRALLLRIQDILSDNDRHRLHFLLGEDVPKYLRDDLSLSGTLRLLDSLLEKTFISDRDCDYLIEAFKKINCLDAARRLQEYQKTREQSNHRNFSLQDILLQDNEEDKISFPRIMPDILDSLLTADPSASLAEVTLTCNQPISSPPVDNSTEEHNHRSRWMDLISKMKLNTCEFVLLILLIITIILALFAHLASIKLWCKPVQRHTTTTRGIPTIQSNDRWAQNGVTIAGGHGRGNASNQLHSPRGLFVDDNKTIVISDNGNHRIMQWKMGDTNGKVVAGGNGQGNRLDQLNRETHVLMDKKTDSLIICDRWNRRVIRWSRLSNTTQGEILFDNISCLGLAMDDQSRLYISDIEKREVRQYQIGDKIGTLVAGSHGPGAGLHQILSPYFIFVDQQQNVYVSDNGNHRVMKWNKGAKEGIVVAGGQGVGSALTQLRYPNGLFVDTIGTLYVADDLNHRVMRWPQGAKQGTVIVGGNGQGQGANQFNGVADLFFDRHGQLYVVDWGNHRVQRFSLEGEFGSAYACSCTV